MLVFMKLFDLRRWRIKLLMWTTKLWADEAFLKMRYKVLVNQKLCLNNPRTFQEKLQWLKLYNRNLEYTQMVDKLAVKEYVANLIGKEYVIPTLAVYDQAEEIDFGCLPDSFVLKTTHGGGGNGVVICRNKGDFDKKKAIKKIRKSLKQDLYLSCREWPYKDVPKKIVVEEYIKNQVETELIDYKFFCFDGVPKYCQVIMNRQTRETIDFFDMQWIHQDFYGLNPNVGPAKETPVKPKNFEKMVEIATILSCNIPFLRVDLYNIDSKIYFGELTFFPASGFGRFTPQVWNYTLGEWIKLPEKSSIS